jgi:hypothetical protein
MCRNDEGGVDGGGAQGAWVRGTAHSCPSSRAKERERAGRSKGGNLTGRMRSSRGGTVSERRTPLAFPFLQASNSTERERRLSEVMREKN